MDFLEAIREESARFSALVHSATMVAAGVYLAGRFYPMFTPEAHKY